MRERGDPFLIVVVASLICIGLIMVYSAGSAVAEKRFGDSHIFLKKRLLHLVVGILFLMVFKKIDYHLVVRFSLPILMGAFLLLIFLVVSPTVEPIKGAKRSIDIGEFNFQPAEAMKLALVLYLSNVLIKKKDRLHDFVYGILPQFIILSLALCLIMLQPHLGTAVVTLSTCMVIFFAARVKLSHLGLYGLSTLPLVFIALKRNPYQWNRVTTYINSLFGGQSPEYQVQQSLISFGRGGVLGAGIGHSSQKDLFLPEPYSDFIFSILGEELGFVGVFIVISLFSLLMWRGLKIASRAPDEKGTLLAVGITGMITVNALLNIGVVTNLLPTTGIPLPFISYGGSSLVVNMTAVGVLLNISSAITEPQREYQEVFWGKAYPRRRRWWRL